MEGECLQFNVIEQQGALKSEGNTSGFVWFYADLYPVNVVAMVLIHIPDKT